VLEILWKLEVRLQLNFIFTELILIITFYILLGTAYVVYEDIWDAKNACDHLSGFNVCNRYLVVLYYQSTKAFKQQDLGAKQEEINKMKEKYNISSEDLRPK
jgi:hypothetical protein